MTNATPWQTAWITGASSGIGREVALALARRGVRVAASSRSADKLAELAKLDERIVAVPVDVTDRAAVATAVEEVRRRLGTLDLAILNAGVWQPMGARQFDAGKSLESMTVNYQGICNGLEALIPGMISAQKGHVALVSSVAGYRGLPKAVAYAPSKAAVISLAETLAPDLGRFGVKVSIVNPGFVATPMTAINDFPMPFIITGEDAAERIVKGLAKGSFEVAFPWQLVWPLKILRALPYSVYLWYVRTFMMR